MSVDDGRWDQLLALVSADVVSVEVGRVDYADVDEQGIPRTTLLNVVLLPEDRGTVYRAGRAGISLQEAEKLLVSIASEIEGEVKVGSHGQTARYLELPVSELSDEQRGKWAKGIQGDSNGADRPSVRF